MTDANSKYIPPTQKEREQILEQIFNCLGELDYLEQRLIYNQLINFLVYKEQKHKASRSNVIKPDFKVFKKKGKKNER